MNTFHLQIITCDRVFYDGECESLIFPGFDGQIEILAHHAPMATTVAVGEVRFRDAEGKTQAVIVSDGIVNTADNTVTLLAFSAERPGVQPLQRGNGPCYGPLKRCEAHSPG